MSNVYDSLAQPQRDWDWERAQRDDIVERKDVRVIAPNLASSVQPEKPIGPPPQVRPAIISPASAIYVQIAIHDSKSTCQTCLSTHRSVRSVRSTDHRPQTTDHRPLLVAHLLRLLRLLTKEFLHVDDIPRSSRVRPPARSGLVWFGLVTFPSYNYYSWHIK